MFVSHPLILSSRIVKLLLPADLFSQMAAQLHHLQPLTLLLHRLLLPLTSCFISPKLSQKGGLFLLCEVFYYNKLKLHFRIIFFSTDYNCQESSLGRTRSCFLPIDVRCLHITQTVRLWTRQEEKVSLETKEENNTMTVPSEIWSMPMSSNVAINENIFIRYMKIDTSYRHRLVNHTLL